MPGQNRGEKNARDGECGTSRDLAAGSATRAESFGLRSIEEIATGSASAKTAVNNKVQQWELYRAGLRQQVSGFARLRHSQLAPGKGPARPASTARPAGQGPGPAEKTYAALVPRLALEVKGREFSLQSWPKYTAHLKEHPDALKTLGLTSQQATSILNYVNGQRSILEIRNTVVGETARDVSLDAVAGYLELLKTVGWIAW